MPQTLPRVAALGECMIELARREDRSLGVAYGGDTLNTAVYLARLGIPVDFITALGDDSFSEDMIGAWAGEGVGVNHVLRVPGRLPGLYMVDTDPVGERRFLYWRDAAPARDLFVQPEAPMLAGYHMLYLSGISLAIWGEEGRAKFFHLAELFRGIGGKIVFDTNYRPRLWPDQTTAANAYQRMLELTDLAFPGISDLKALFGDADTEAVLARLAGYRIGELAVKLEQPGALIVDRDGRTEVPCEPVTRVVDTTAAGDSFSAGYLAARLQGLPAREAARAGHRLAGRVIQYPGAIIPRDAMTDLMPA